MIGHLPGRMALQNRWAEEVLQEFPGIAVCDLWQVVKDDHDQYYRDWWFARNYNFDYTPAVPLARTLATEILRALGRDPQQINPPEVHAVKVRKSDQ